MNFKETNTFKVTLINNNYFYVEVKSDVEFEVEDIKNLVAFQKSLGGEKKYPVLINPCSTATTNSDTIKYLSKNTNLPYTVADAFVISSVGQKILAKIYTRIISTQRPTGFFSNKDEAMKWLEQFITAQQ